MSEQTMVTKPLAPFSVLAVGLMLVMLGLGVQLFTNLVVLAVVGVFVISGRALVSLDMRFMKLTLLLVSALFAQHIVATYQEITPLTVAVKAMVFGWLSYCIGYWFVARDERINDLHLVVAAASLATGFVLLGFAAALDGGFPLQTTHVVGAVSPLTGEPMHKTYIGMSASLGMCLAPVALLWRPQSSAQKAIRIWCLVLVLTGFLANVALQNRTPVLAIVLTLAAAGAIKLRAWLLSGVELKGWVSLFLVTPTVIIAGALLVWAAGDFWSEVVFKQFYEKGGLETPRYIAWKAMISGFFDHFWGGRRIVLTEAYAHNFWLDILWDSGIPAFSLWVVFHVIHFLMAFAYVFRCQSELRKFVILGLAVSFLMSFTAEPVNAASQYYVWGSLFFFGVVAALQASEVKGR